MTSEQIIDKALKELAARSSAYRKARAYYDGRHQLAFATEKFQSAFGSLFKKFADNLMPPVVDAVKDSLVVTGFNVEAGDGSLADQAWKLWQDGRLARRAGQVHKEALRAGDAYLIVWPDREGRPSFHPNKAHLCTVNYDDEDSERVSSAVKLWQRGDKRYRLNVYYSDRIEKYVTRQSHPGGMPESSKAFDIFEMQGEPWPLENPYGVVPVFHFANNADIGETGRSELADSMSLQDALNKAVLDKMVAMEFAAFPQRYAIGLEVETDPVTGRPINPFQGVERWVTVGNDNAKFGQFEGANLEQFLKVQDSFRMEIARVSGTPLHYFFLQTSVPSGEALKTIEKRFVKKVKDRQGSFGQVWEDVIALALKMSGENSFGESSDVRLFAQWEDPAPASDGERLDNIIKKQDIGIDEEQALIEAGYGLKDIEAMQLRKAKKVGDAAREFDGGESFEGTDGGNTTGRAADDLTKRVAAAGALIRAGFVPDAALRAVGLDPIKHTNLLPVTLKTDE
ncbi:MAG: phage portal protein [Pyrinomonadaceae bacterium]